MVVVVKKGHGGGGGGGTISLSIASKNVIGKMKRKKTYPWPRDVILDIS